MPRMITSTSALILTLLALPIASHAEERSDWRQPAPQVIETQDVETIAKLDTAAGSTFSAVDAAALLEQAGYADITQLEQVNPFVWRAHGAKDGLPYALTVDYSGTVVGIDAP